MPMPLMKIVNTVLTSKTWKLKQQEFFNCIFTDILSKCWIEMVLHFATFVFSTKRLTIKCSLLKTEHVSSYKL